MDNGKSKSAICQCLAFVPFEKLSPLTLHCLDRGKSKLFTIPLLKAFIAGQFKDWRSYDQMETGLDADENLLEELGISSISSSQLSRRIAAVPTELLQELFVHTVMKIQPLCKDLKGVTTQIGKLKVVDSSRFRLPENRCSWAYLSSESTGVKVHVRLSVESPDVVYPDKVVPSLSGIDDRRGATALVVDSDATYVLDRGYVDYKQMDNWVDDQILFVVRLVKNNKATVIEEYPVQPNSHIVRDARVKLGSKFRSMEKEIRLVEFLDEEGRKYRIATNRWDLTAEEIAEIYKHRWLIGVSS